MERDKVGPSSFSFPSLAQCDGGSRGDVCARVCARVSRQGPGKCEYGCGTLPTEHGSGEGGKEREKERERKMRRRKRR